MQVTLRSFVKDLQNALGQAAAQKSLQLGKGQCGTIEEYKKITGYIAGLDGAREISEQMLRGIEDASRQEDGELPEMPPVDPPKKRAAGGKK